MNNPQNKKTEKPNVSIVDSNIIQDKIYVVRGVQVMIDFELAEIYGYETKDFNRQVKNNIEKFEGEDFMFQLSKPEFDEILRCKKSTSSWGGARYLPHAFTEQGVYMLMTVLRGELAIRQSRSLVMAFKRMKDYIVQNQSLITHHDYLRLSMQVSDSQQTVQSVQNQLIVHGEKLNSLFAEMQETVKRSEISPYLLDFSRPEDQKEYLILDGQPAKADETYIDIYSQAKNNIYIIDNYVNIKTLRLLQNVQSGVDVVIFTDNLLNCLHARDYTDFQTEFPNIPVIFRRTCKTTHDRFIILDFGTKDERIFHCGASSKDAGVKLMTVISEMRDSDFKKSFEIVVRRYLGNPILTLK